VIGIGAGDPDYVTAQAVDALNDTQVFFAMDKGSQKDDLVALRRLICERFIREPGYRFVELADPQRAKDGDYRQAVADWHAARAAVWADAIASEVEDGATGAFLAWGDPSLYDSTLRILDLVADRVDIDYDVIPGITAIQALTARHRIPLNDVGEPVLVTTGRQLREAGLTGTAVVMLDGECSFQACPPRTRIWWGAYLGTPDELLVAGTVGEVGFEIVEMRAAARAKHGWIMDTYLLRPAD
jgi:precorrin-6A synthase